MKLVYDEKQKKTVEELYKTEDRFRLFSGDPEKEYSINFKVTNPAWAQFVITLLLNDKLPEVDLGINITSINFEKYTSREDIKSELHRMIDGLNI